MSFSFAGIYPRILSTIDFIHFLLWLIVNFIESQFIRKDFWILMPTFLWFDLRDFHLILMHIRCLCSRLVWLRNCRNSCSLQIVSNIFHRTKKFHLMLSKVFFCIRCMRHNTFNSCCRYFELNSLIWKINSLCSNHSWSLDHSKESSVYL